MTPDASLSPRHYLGVTVSSTFTDLQEHRAALIKAIKSYGLTDVAMENDAAKPMDVINSSLQMVRDGSAYIGIIGKKYGQIPECPSRNPKRLSITELEFNEALRLDRPILLFIMGEDCLVRESDIEANAKKKKQLKAFRERAKQIKTGSSVHRIYSVFNTLEEFKEKIGPSIAGLHTSLEALSAKSGSNLRPLAATSGPIPKPPAFYAEPDYIGSHQFVGRKSELQDLDDWARPADPHTILLFEAIGGNGKSMLTWEWTKHHATKVRADWAGRFWYSFYEKGAVTADFCQRAMAYMTGQPLEELRRKKTRELSRDLLAQLHAKPWLLILDGLERVLVAYHRIDAAEVSDEEVNNPTDKIVNRDPCAAIRDEDDDLLHLLAGATPSKVLVSSRLTPRVLLNTSNQTIPGVRRIALPGLRPPDAEELFRSCGIKGSSQAIQSYLTTNCDCHPLVVGVLAGLISSYLPAKGNFDSWVVDSNEGGGAQLNLANLDLIQRRNHILRAALAALPEINRQLLSTLALLPDSVEYSTLSALNPHLPTEPDEVSVPEKPEESPQWTRMRDEQKAKALKVYETALECRKEYERALGAYSESAKFRTAPSELAKTVRDLERRGLLQYDDRTRRYDLHPVVRGVASGDLGEKEKERYGQKVADYFSQQSHSPYEKAETLEDVRVGLNLVRTLIKIGDFQRAFDTYHGELFEAILFNLEGHSEILSLLRPFFPVSWDVPPSVLDASSATYLANSAAIALSGLGESKEALAAYGAGLAIDLKANLWKRICSWLYNISSVLSRHNIFAKSERVSSYALEIAALTQNSELLFPTRLFRFDHYSETGRLQEAEAIWQLLDPMGRTWPRSNYRPGHAEKLYARFQFNRETLQEEHLAAAERLAKEGHNRTAIRDLHRLRGKWQLNQREWALAAASFQEALRMARERELADSEAETGLTLAKFYLGQLANPHREAERLAGAKSYAPILLARLWINIGEHERAKEAALHDYKWAWADGEPYVLRYELTKTTELLHQLGVPIPNLPPYDPAKDEKFPWEDALVAGIEKLRTEKKAEEEN